MSTKHRPRRSMLYMPGSNARALEKGRGLDADALILELEDFLLGFLDEQLEQFGVEVLGIGRDDR